MDGQQQRAPHEVNGFARGIMYASLITIMGACVVAGGCVAVKANAVNPHESPRTDVVNVRHSHGVKP